MRIYRAHGLRQQPYIVSKHKNIERKHIYIVSLRVDENGHKLSGEIKDIIPYVVATFAYSRFSGVNSSKRYRSHFPFIKPFCYTTELYYPDD